MRMLHFQKSNWKTVLAAKEVGKAAVARAAQEVSQAAAAGVVEAAAEIVQANISAALVRDTALSCYLFQNLMLSFVLSFKFW